MAIINSLLALFVLCHPVLYGNEKKEEKKSVRLQRSLSSASQSLDEIKLLTEYEPAQQNKLRAQRSKVTTQKV